MGRNMGLCKGKTVIFMEGIGLSPWNPQPIDDETGYGDDKARSAGDSISPVGEANCQGKQISVDGKTLRGASNMGDTNIHMVSAWVQEDGITMGQVRTEEKSNEITAIPALLGALDIRGGTVSMDAMGCQKAIAQQIIEQDAHYLLAVKGNHPTLLADIVEYFEWARKDPVEKKFLPAS